MNKLFFLPIALFIFAACSQWNPLTVTPPSNIKVESVFGDVNNAFLQNDQFMQCSKQSIDQCIDQTMKTWWVEKSCSNFLLESNKILCEDSMLMIQARDTGDRSICDKVSDPWMCNYELTLLKGIQEESVELCDNVSEARKIPCNNYIINYLSQKKKDKSMCEGIISEYKWDNAKEFCEEEVNMLLQEGEWLKK